MSYVRYNEPLKYFKGVSNCYVFPTYKKSDDENGENINFIEDYDSTFSDKLTLLDIVCRIVQHETDDEKFTLKIAKALAKITNSGAALRPLPITSKEWSKESQEITNKLMADPSYREFLRNTLKKGKDIKKK